MWSNFFQVPGETSSSSEANTETSVSGGESEDPTEQNRLQGVEDEDGSVDEADTGANDKKSGGESEDPSKHESSGGTEDGDGSGDEADDSGEIQGNHEDENESGDEAHNRGENQDRQDPHYENNLWAAEDTHTATSRFERDFMDIKSLARGSDGKIYECTHRIDRNKYVVKRIPTEDNGGKIPFEIFAHSRLNHNYIVRFHQVWQEPYVRMKGTSSSEEDSATVLNHKVKSERYYILMEKCPRTLSNLWVNKDKVDVPKAWDRFTQVAEAVSFIHEKGYIHCDLNTENVLLDKEETVKICDFGMGRFQEGKEAEGVSVLDIKPSDLANTSYRAPELLNNDLLNKYRITEKVDIYSMAMIAVDLFYITERERSPKRTAFKEKKELPNMFENEDPRIINLLLSMIHDNPACRPSAKEVVSVLAQKKESAQRHVVIVVRATSFIVSAVAQPLLKAGCKVMVNFGTRVNEEDSEEISSKLKPYGDRARKFVNDLLTDKDMESMITEAVDAWGTIDIVINNAEDNGATLLDLSDFRSVSDRVSAALRVVAMPR